MFRSSIPAALVLAVGFTSAQQPQPQPPPVTVRQAGALELHRPVDREIGPGQTDAFTVEAATGQFLRVVTNQKGVDVIVRIVAPDGKVLVSADRLNGTYGPESASAIAPAPGIIQVRIEKNPQTPLPGRYVVELTDLHDPTDQDSLRIEAETKLFQAYAENAPATRLHAIDDFTAAASLFAQLQDTYEQGICFFSIGDRLRASGDRPKAMDAYQRALEFQRQAADRHGEAQSLANLGGLWGAMGDRQKALQSYDQSLVIWREIEYRGADPSRLRTIASFFNAAGEKQRAIDIDLQALSAARAAAMESVEDSVLSDLATLYRLPQPQPGPAEPQPARDEVQIHLVPQIWTRSGASALALSPDGRFVVTVAAVGEPSALLWNVADGKVLHILEGFGSPVTGAAFLPDGSGVVIGSADATTRIFDIRTGQEIQRIPSGSASGPIAVSPGGDFIVAADSGVVQLFDRRSGSHVRSFIGHAGVVRGVAFSPNGRWLATASRDCTVRLWDVATGKEIRQLPGFSSAVNTVAFSPDGTTLATGSGWRGADSPRYNWSLPLAERQRLGHEDAVAGEHNIRLWDMTSFQEIRKIDLPGTVLALAFSRDGRYLASGGGISGDSASSPCVGCELHLWDLVSRRDVRPNPQSSSGAARTLPFRAVALSPDARLLVAGNDSEVVVSEALSGRDVARLQGYARADTWLAIDSRFIAIGGANQLWDRQKGRPAPLSAAITPFAMPDISPGGAELAAATGRASDSQIVFWNLRTNTEARRISRPGTVKTPRYSPDGRFLLVQASDQPPCMIEAATGSEVRCFPGIPPDTIRVSSFSPRGDAVIAAHRSTPTSNSVTIRVWDANTGAALQSITGPVMVSPGPAIGFSVNAAVSPVGETIAISGRSTFLYNWRTGALIRELFTSTSVFGLPVAFSPDGQSLVVASSGSAGIWDVSTGRELWIAPSLGAVFDMKFSQDGRFLFLTGSSGLTTVWDFAARKQVCTLVSFTDGSWAVTDPDGRYDASNPDEAIGLHWVADDEVIELGQLKQRFYTPGLFGRALTGEKLPDVASIHTVKLFPAVEVSPPAPGSTRLNVKLTNRGGGMGRVVVRVNGKELAADVRAPGLDPNSKVAQFPVDLAAAVRAADGNNSIEVIAYDGLNLLSSRGVRLEWKTAATPVKRPRLFAVIAGVSEYDNPALNLQYPSKDAKSFAEALRLAGEGLLGKGQVFIHLLATGGAPGARPPTKDEFRDAFSSIIRDADQDDILVVYLAGHGVAQRGAADRYYYLTQSARSTEPPIADLKMLDLSTVSSDDLKNWCLSTKALKQVIVLDTCAAGAALAELNKLVARRDLSPDQKRAIELLKDSTGSFILMGSATDAVSYEASRYGQGVLTYALLQGMKGEALEEGQRVDVLRLFNFASTRVVQLAADIGGIQQPQVSSPGGHSFPIGLLSDQDKRAIVLANAKPQLLRVQCFDDQEGDSLGLTPLVRARLRDASQPATRGIKGSDPPLVYVDEMLDIPSAMSPVVRYRTVAAGRIEARVILRRDNRVVSNETVAASADPAATAAVIADALIQAAAQAGSQ